MKREMLSAMVRKLADGVIRLEFSSDSKFAIPIFSDKAKVVPKVIKPGMTDKRNSPPGKEPPSAG